MMMINTQDKLRRIQRPRVYITYDVETEGSEKKLELPFVVGVLGHFSGDTPTEIGPDTKIEFSELGTDNFDAFLLKQNPTLSFTVPNILTNAGNIMINLSFTSRLSFQVLQVIKQIDVLYEFYNKINITGKIAILASNNPALADLLVRVILNKKADNLVSQLKERLPDNFHPNK